MEVTTAAVVAKEDTGAEPAGANAGKQRHPVLHQGSTQSSCAFSISQTRKGGEQNSIGQ